MQSPVVLAMHPTPFHSSNDAPPIFLSPPHMTGDEQLFIAEAFRTNWIAPLGPNVDAFEREFGETLHALPCCATSSGTAAIHLGLSLLGVGAGDFVLAHHIAAALGTPTEWFLDVATIATDFAHELSPATKENL